MGFFIDAPRHRVFKYADKGFGIRFLPSYIDSLPTNSGVQPSAIANREYMTPRGAYDVDVVRTIDFDNIMKESRQWTRRWIEVYVLSSQNSLDLL